MKLIKTASNIEVKLSLKDWENIGKKAGWTETAQNKEVYDFTAGEARAKSMRTDELQYAIKDLQETIKIQEQSAKQGGNVPKLGYYWDEYHTYSGELKRRRCRKTTILST